jgi:hypothetical protein
MAPQFPDAWPVHETFIGYFWSVPITEYTIHGVLGRVAKAWGYIAASDPAGARAGHDGEQQPMQQRGDASEDVIDQQHAGATSPEASVGAAGVLMPLVVPEDDSLLRSDPAIEPAAIGALGPTGALAPSAPDEGNADAAVIRVGDVLDDPSAALTASDEAQHGAGLASALEQLGAAGPLNDTGWGAAAVFASDRLLPPLELDPTA